MMTIISGPLEIKGDSGISQDFLEIWYSEISPENIKRGGVSSRGEGRAVVVCCKSGPAKKNTYNWDK